jgi:DtxR family transcriptional regulator, manganese transport regulator
MKHKAMYSTMMREKDPNNPRTQIQLRREAAVRALLGRADGKLSQEIIEDLKKDLGVSRATAYRMIKTFRSCGMVVAPTTRPVGRPKGARVLDPKREFLIHDAIRNFYLRPLRPKFSELVQEIGRRCRAERLPPPNWRTIKSRVQDILAQNGRR